LCRRQSHCNNHIEVVNTAIISGQLGGQIQILNYYVFN
jgi:hypothetical protein